MAILQGSGRYNNTGQQIRTYRGLEIIVSPENWGEPGKWFAQGDKAGSWPTGTMALTTPSPDLWWPQILEFLRKLWFPALCPLGCPGTWMGQLSFPFWGLAGIPVTMTLYHGPVGHLSRSTRRLFLSLFEILLETVNNSGLMKMAFALTRSVKSVLIFNSCNLEELETAIRCQCPSASSRHMCSY